MELNKIYLGDCYELIKQIPDKSIDLVITDPPYEMETGGTGHSELSLRFRNRYRELENNKLDVGMDLTFLNELERVCKKIYLYIWCNKNLLFKLISHYIKRSDVNMDLITWGKTNPMPLSNNFFLNDTEYCLCIHEKGLGWNVNCGSKVKRKCYMTEVNKFDKKQYGHPTIKPIEIIKNFILNSSERGG